MELVLDSATLALIRAAKVEDLADADLTTLLLAQREAPARFELTMKQPGVFAGRVVTEAVLAEYSPALRMTWSDLGTDGALIASVPAVLGVIDGPLAAVLAAERVLLNFVQRLSGVATLTRRFVDAVAGTSARIFDTRKTTPGWRLIEKHAVRCGGGRSHRSGLYDAVLLKDNHLAGIAPQRLAGEVFNMLNRIGTLPHEPIFVEVEAKSVEEARALFRVVGIHIVLLDNFSVHDLAEAVELRDSLGLKDRVELEASGGVTLQNVRAVAETGVERISVGALTHSAPALDLSLERVA